MTEPSSGQGTNASAGDGPPAAKIAAAAPADPQEEWGRANGVLQISADESGRVTVALPRTASADQLTKLQSSARANWTAVGNSLRSGAKGTSVTTVRRSTLTAADLETTRRKLGAFNDKYRKYSFSFSYDAAKDATVVKGNMPASMTAELRKTGKVIVEPDPRATFSRDVATVSTLRMRAQQGKDRWNDTGEWHYGGAWITSGPYGECTSGFSMHASGGYTYSVTAGHCGLAGTTWRTGAGIYGKASYRPDFPRNDFQKLDAACCTNDKYGNVIWTSSRSTRFVAKASNPWVGYNGSSGECISGAVGGAEFCYGTVRSLNATYCNSDGCTPSLISYTFDGRAQRAWPGDSGAPVYTLTADGKANIHGIHVARSFSGGTTHYAEKYSTIKNWFGGQIRTW